MKIFFKDSEIPYPLSILRGHLKLCGLQDEKVATLLSRLNKKQRESKSWTESDILNFLKRELKRESSEISDSFDAIVSYEKLRGKKEDIPPVIVVLEGASATGKSMIALDMIQEIGSTRFISTDTVRQIIREFYSKEEYPELHCHTYQAFKYRQSGDESLDPIVRGYNAQCELVFPLIIGLVRRIISEGALAIIEGVHIQPGSLNHISESILEILINPNYKIHQSMFIGKSTTGKLKSVSSDEFIRKEEFNSTRIIQDYLEGLANKCDITIIQLEDYEEANREIGRLVIKKIKHLIEVHE